MQKWSQMVLSKIDVMKKPKTYISWTLTSCESLWIQIRLFLRCGLLEFKRVTMYGAIISAHKMIIRGLEISELKFTFYFNSWFQLTLAISFLCSPPIHGPYIISAISYVRLTKCLLECFFNITTLYILLILEKPNAGVR